MFRNLSILVFVVTVGGVFLHWIAAPCKGCRWNPIKKVVHLFTLLLFEQKLSLVGAIKKLIYLVALFCFVVLAVTGFYPLLIKGEHISGYLMMIHATFAPIFILCLAFLAVAWASSYRFNKSDWPWLRNILRWVTSLKIPVSESIEPSSQLFEKTGFWLIVFLALPLILSIIVSMFSIFGTAGQEFLLAAHRWTALVFAVVAIIYTYLVIRGQLKQ